MKFLFCSVASHGFVYPAIGIAHELRRRGHDIAFVTGHEFEPTLREAGFARIPRGAADGPSFQVKRWSIPLSAAIQVKHIEYALQHFEADVLVGQPLTLGPLIVAERRRLPIGIIGLAAYLWPTGNAEHSSNDLLARRRWRYNDMLRLFNETRALFKLPPSDAPAEQSPLLGDLFLVQSVPELADDMNALPDRVRLTGSCLWEPPHSDPALTQWLHASQEMGHPVLYVQHGRTFDHPRFWSSLVEAVAGKPVRVAAAAGRLDGDVGVVPPNMLVRSHLSQAHVLPWAQAAVSSGTTTPVLGALTHGRPSILFPAGGEQVDVAAQCERAGVALVVPPDSDSITIWRAIEQVLADQTMQRRAKTLQRAFRKVRGSERAAEYLETLGTARLHMEEYLPQLEHAS